MGIYDREYLQDDASERGFTLGGGTMMLVTRLVIINVAIVLIDAFTPQGRALSDFLSLDAEIYRHPWQAYQVLTYGFSHSPLGMPGGIWHVAMNMFLLWMFGREIELRLGRKEFLTYYLTTIVFAGLVWLGLENLWLHTTDQGAAYLLVAGRAPHLLGASGGVMAVFILFVLYDPRRTLYVWGMLAVPAWLIGVILVGSDYLRAISGQAGNVAWQAHLAGAGFAFVYFHFRWNLSRLLPSGGRKMRWGPRLKVLRPDQDQSDLDAQADEVLAKVHREGMDSLTARERRILERHSRRLRERHGGK